MQTESLMMVFTGALVVVGSFQLLVFGLQARRLRQTIETMDKTAERQLRAYVCFVTGGFVAQDRNTDYRYEVRPFVKNTGQTPAYEVFVSSRARLLPFPLPADVDLSVPDEPTAADNIGPGQSFFFRAWLDRMLTNEEIAEITTGIGRKLYIYGTVRYKDAFGHRRYTNFCQFSVWDRGGNYSGINSPRQNDAD
jgi:hypothetical protein